MLAASLVVLLPKHVPEFMRLPLAVHVTAGLVAVVVGYVALCAAKGGALHRKSGTVFVYAMVTMGILAAVVAASEPKIGSVTGGLFAAYLVVSAMTTVRPPTEWSRRLDRGGMLLAFAVGALSIVSAGVALSSGSGTQDGVPLAVPFIYGAIALAAGLGDLRMIRAGGIRGSRRIARHLWRMCFSMFTATGSFFLGQAHVIPKPLRIMPLLAILALLPLVALAYWMWRIRVRQRLRGIVIAAAPEAAG